MQVHLEYHRDGLTAELPDKNVVKCLGYKPAEPLSDPAAKVRSVLENPTGTPSLAELAKDKKDACIVICDITRPVPNELVLTPMLEMLEAAGIARENILILVATGMHRPNDREELIEMVGQTIVENYRIENHHGQNLTEHTYLGDSPRGVPVWIDTRYVQADLKITIGLIEPHFMAGFSGGRKLICPGIAALETIGEWHSPRFLEHPKSAPGSMDGNPVHEENTWIGRQAGCDFIVNTVLNDKRQVLNIVAGDMIEALEEGVAFVRGVVTDTVDEPVDIVVTSGAGYPLDTTYYQAVKGIVAAMDIVKPGGTIIIAAGVREGVGGPEFCRIFEENDSLEEFMRRVKEESYFVMDQWQLIELAKAARKAKVVFVTDALSAETLQGLFVESAESVESAVAAALEYHGPEATIAVIPKGPYVLTEVASR